MSTHQSDEFDLIVLGGGPAGEHALGRASKAGLDTALVEQELIGGECSYWACMPSKTLLRPGQVLEAARHAPGASEAVTGRLDAAAAMKRRDWMVSDWNDDGQVKWVESTGGHVVRGHGRISGVRTVQVSGAAKERTLLARKAVLVATGSSAAIPPIPGLAETRHWDNRQITAAHEVPGRLAVIGGGVVGVEMAQAWRRLGAREVTIVESGERLLAQAEPFAGELLAKVFDEEGIDVVTGTGVGMVTRANESAPAELTLEDGRTIVADELLVATGRRPRTVDIGLDTLGLTPGRYLEVDAQMCVRDVTGGWLYAIGDANGIALLTHMGKYQARIALDAIAGSAARRPYDGEVAVPSVIFTDPQIASVGLTEQAARARGIDVVTATVGTDSVAASSVLGDNTRGTCKVVADRAGGFIVGATFTGPEIAELLHSATIAIIGRVPVDLLRHAVPSFPTLSEVWLELIDTLVTAI